MESGYLDPKIGKAIVQVSCYCCEMVTGMLN